MKLCSILVGIFFSLFVFSQKVGKVDFDVVKAEIADSTGRYYYPLLQTKLMSVDSVLSQSDYFFLYYGLVFQSYYHPYGSSNRKKEFIELFNYEKYSEALREGDLVLQENPVDLEVLLKMSILHLKKENHDMKRFYARHYFSFLEVIYQSGDGKSIESSFVVVSVDHEYMISADLGLQHSGQALIGDCDLLYISKKGQPKIKGQKKIRQLYFNVRMPLMSLSNSYKDADLPDPDDE